MDLFPPWVYFWRQREYQKQKAVLDKVIHSVISHKREKGIRDDDNTLLACMLRYSQTEEGAWVTDQQLRDHVMLFLLGGTLLIVFNY